MRNEEMARRAVNWAETMRQKYGEMIDKCKQDTVLYNNEDISHEFISKYETQFELTDIDSVTAIHEYSKDKAAVLNFASYKNPGGGFLNGYMAQEESLCYNSFLFNILEDNQEYYKWNREHLNGGFYLNRALYTPDVLFNERTLCDVITCAAPNATRMLRYRPDEKEKNTCNLVQRIYFVLAIAAMQGVDTLILGAYGCGVFKQNPTEVATIFMRFLKEEFRGTFKKVVFAIPGKDSDNYIKFQEVFEKTWSVIACV